MGLGKRVFYALAVFIFQAYITGCAAGFQDIGQTQKDYGIEKLPSAEEYPQHEAVIVLESHKIDVSIDNNFDVFTIEDVHVVKRIFRNVENHAEVEINLGYGEKLKSIQARAITSTGQILELEKKEFLHSKGSSDGSVFYSDERSTRFTFRGVDKGSIVEYKYRIQKDYPFQMDVWYVQGSLPILRNEYKLFVPTILLDNNWNWFFKSYNYDVGLPKIEKAGISANKTLDSKNTYTWLVQNIPAFEREPRMNSYYHHAGHVRFAPSYWNSWNAIADWYYKNLFLPQLIVTPQISEKAQSLIANVADEKSKVQRLSDYVKKIRYTAIELGIGGIRPNTPQTVYDRQYGDCKDKATLLIAMLKSVGITAHPVLVRTANAGFVDAQFPSWNFNHMIVKIALSGGKTIWTDPTSETSQFGFLPWSDEDIDVFVLYPDGTGMIEHTPTSSHTNNLTDVHIQGEAIGDMGMKFEIKIDFFGNDYSYYLYRLRDMSQNELENFCKNLIVDEYLNSKISNVRFSENDTAGKPLSLVFETTVEKVIQAQGDLYFANIDPFKLFESWSWLASEQRRFPIRTIYPYLIKKRIEIKFPANLTIRNLPKPHNESIDYFSYNRSYQQAGNDALIFNETYAVTERSVPAIEYNTVRKFFDKIKSGMAEKVILTK